MSDVIIAPPKQTARSKVTLRAVYQELKQLRERVEDLEDLRDLKAAIARNGNKKLIPWSSAKKSLALED